MKKQIIYILLAIISLPIILFAGREIQQLLTRAAPQPANIVIDTTIKLNAVSQPWAAFAQGGEEPPPMLSPAVAELRKLSPRFIRLDHIYDYYSIVRKEDDKFVYDFKILDKTIDDIISIGAVPFLSLSYMPKDFTRTGSVIDYPSDWNNWKDLVKATITHISGKQNRNLHDVYYEIWNEPELPQFGDFRLGGNKDYRLLYYYASLGAKEAENVNNFFIGGPAVGSYYPNWVTNFISYVEQNDLRLDFYSWHRYHKNASYYTTDARNIRRDLSNFTRYANIPILLTEWGIDSDNSDLNNSNTAAAYTISAISQFQNDINLAFTFEPKDGPPPNGGKWGLLTHEKNSNPLSPKPRFKVFEALTKIRGLNLSVNGEGTYVKAVSSIDGNNVYAILSNYDLSGRNTENVPVTFVGLAPSSYNLKYTYILDNTSGYYEIVTTNGVLSKTFVMQPNSVLLLELTPLGKIATFIPGVSGNANDKALILKNNISPLVFKSPEFHLLPSGEISFDIKPLWNNNDNKTFLIFESPFYPDTELEYKMFLMKSFGNSGNNLVFGISKNNEVVSVSRPADKLTFDTWHHIYLSWSPTGSQLSIDDQYTKSDVPLDIRNGDSITFYPVDAAMDNLKISVGNQTISRNFDNQVDK